MPELCRLKALATTTTMHCGCMPMLRHSGKSQYKINVILVYFAFLSLISHLQAVKEHQSLQCKCFGLSGVCTSKTCHRALLPRMETIGMWLKHKYGQAVHVKPSRRRNRSGYPRFLVQKNGRGRPNMNNLIYLEDSPTYCERDWSTGSLGTKGRRCNITVAGESNSCQLLCCGRGYDTRIQTIKRMCNCKFRWCCEVECDECRNTCRVYTCK